MKKIDQVPAVVHVAIYQGDSWTASLDFNLDLTGYTIAATITPADASDPVSLAIAETDLANGQYSVTLSDSQSASLPAGYHKWTIAMSDDETDRTYVCGKFIVESC